MTAPQSLLLIDDDATLTGILSRAFKRRDWEVAEANNRQEALQRLAHARYSHCVLDLKLQQESGLALLPELLKQQPDLKVVILTGYSSINTAVDAIKLGAVNYLCKPADADEILLAFEHTEGSSETEINETPPSVNRLEWEHIQKVLADHDGNISAIARALGMHRRTLQRKLQKRPVKQ
jgi:two-component system, response regulator RegA